MEIVGVLRNARRVPVGEDSRAPCLAGQVYNDAKGRFWDGDWITTSTIMEDLPDGVFKTRFSAYRVESWAGQPPANDGWIKWGGGACPVDGAAQVSVRYRPMRHEFGFGESDGATAASNYRWEHDGSAGEIIAYRVESRIGQSPANDNLTPRAQFDAASPLQEDLAINISAQIADGVRPDAVQVLEWANALYVAEVGAA